LFLGDFPLWVLYGFSLFFGLIWGSFLNVVIHRVPRGMSVVHPPSQCPACKKPIRPWDNIPVFGWLMLRGKARCCGVKVSPRYPLVEAIGGVLSVAIVHVILLQLPASTPLLRAGAIYVVDLALVLGLVAAAFIDLEHMILPDSITIGGTILGIATASFRDMTFVDSLLEQALRARAASTTQSACAPNFRNSRRWRGRGSSPPSPKLAPTAT